MKNQNEMKLHDESWLNYQKGKGEESFQAYLADLTDMQEHVLPYLQSLSNRYAFLQIFSLRYKWHLKLWENRCKEYTG